jgi:hypothetical protein
MDEQAWAKLKQLLRAAKARTQEVLDQAIVELPPLLTADDAKAWFRLPFDALQHHEKCSNPSETLLHIRDRLRQAIRLQRLQESPSVTLRPHPWVEQHQYAAIFQRADQPPYPQSRHRQL